MGYKEGNGLEAIGYGRTDLTYSLSPIAYSLPHSLLPIAWLGRRLQLWICLEK